MAGRRATRFLRRRRLFGSLVGWLTVALGATLSVGAADLQRVYLRVGSAEEAAHWYADRLGGEAVREGRRWSTAFDALTLHFVVNKEPYDKYQRSAVDHIAFSVADVRAKLEELRAAGVRVVQPVQGAEGLEYSFVEDPWNGKIELLSGEGELGFHHVHIYSKTPKSIIEWYRQVLGGESAGLFHDFEHLPMLRFGGVLVIVQRDNGERQRVPTVGSLIDRLGWAVADLDDFVGRASASGAQVVEAPHRRGDGRWARVEAPDGVMLELEEAAERASR